MRLSLRQIEIYLTVIGEGGFTSAGERLNMVQPAVSIAIRKMESSLGVRLLDRTSQGVRLTEEGKEVASYAKQIFGLIEALDRRVEGLRSLSEGHVTIGAPPMVASYLLPRKVEKFLQAHPKIRVSTVEGSADEIAAGVRQGSIDVGFGHFPSRISDDLEIVASEEHPLVACVAEGSALAGRKYLEWSELFAEPLILFPRGYRQRSILDRAAARLEVSPRVLIESKSARFITEMVRNGRGAALLFGAIAEDQAGIVSILIAGDPSIRISMCRRRGINPSLAAEAFFKATEVM